MDKNGTGNNGTNGQWQNLGPVESKIAVLLRELMDHPGFGRSPDLSSILLERKVL